MSKFKNKLFGCCSDTNLCLLAFLMPCSIPCIQGKAVAKAEKTNACCYPCMLSSFLLTIGCAINRTKIRKNHGKEGSCCMDCVIWSFCPCCAAIQEYLEANRKSIEIHEQSFSNLILDE